MLSRVQKGLAKIKRWDRIYIAIHIAIIIFYLLYFWVICHSAYAADDMLNANAKALDYYPGDSVLKLTGRQFFVWFDRGRFFPFSNYCYILFAYLPSRVAYKFLIIVTVYLNNLLFGKCIQKISKSREIGLLAMIIFPLCIQLTGEFNSALYCYHMLIQNTFMWMLISTLLVFKYIDKTNEGNKRFRDYWYLVAGAVFLFMSLGTYETGFILVSFMGLAVWAYTGKFVKTIIALTPNIITYIIMVLVNVFIRMDMSDSYSGIETSFDPNYVFSAYLKQVVSTFPFARLFTLTKENNGTMPFSKSQLLSKLQMSDIVLVVLFIVIVIYVIKKSFNTIQNIKNILFLFWCGLALLLLPPILIAISSRYQQELVWGIGHISGYVQSFGLVLIVITPVILFIKHCKPQITKIIIGILIVISIPIILLQQMESRIVVESNWNWFQYPRDNIIAACDLGLMDSINSDEILIPSTDYYFDIAESNIFYTYAAKKEINTIIKDAFPLQLSEMYGSKLKYNLKNADKKYYAIVSGADGASGYAILGLCTDVEVDENQKLDSIYTHSALIYVKGFSQFTISYNTLEDSGEIDSSKLELVKRDGDEAIYRISSIEFDLLNAIIQ